jgi:uncharacterized protein HemY
LVVARIETKQQRNDAALAAIDQALKIEPTNSRALELRRQLSGE